MSLIFEPLMIVLGGTVPDRESGALRPFFASRSVASHLCAILSYLWFEIAFVWLPERI
jgi:hypothetical protein